MKKFKNVLLGIFFWLIRLTWGLLDTVYGFVLFLVFAFKIKKVKYIHHTIVCQVDWPGPGWGLEGGLFIFSTEDYIFNTKQHMFQHEFGHCIPQTLVFGPLHPFICSIPSAIRFWYREKKYYDNGIEPPTDYDDFWVEGTASRWGKAWTNGIEKWLDN